MAAIEVEELCRTYRSRKGVIRRKRTDRTGTRPSPGRRDTASKITERW
jgi:hypothetical protein